MRILALKIALVLILFLLPVVHSSAVPGDGPTLLTWTERDVGNTGLAGSYSSSSGTIEVSGSGADIWGNADGFHYVYLPATGEGQVQTACPSLAQTLPCAPEPRESAAIAGLTRAPEIRRRSMLDKELLIT